MMNLDDQQNSRYLRQWPQLNANYKARNQAYFIMPITLLEDICMQDQQAMASHIWPQLAVDFIISAIYEQIGTDFFNDDCFNDRLTAVCEVFLAAKIYLDSFPKDSVADLPRYKKIDALYDQGIVAMQRWNYIMMENFGQTKFKAAESKPKNSLLD